MKLILVGYPGSQKIRKASEYLVKKYTDFDVHWLVYGGEIQGWSQFIADYLKGLTDERIIFALDDYLISDYFDMGLDLTMGDAVCVKLCEATAQENEEYPVTTQYCLWDREYLISLLEQTTSPWDFEIRGSRIFKEQGKELLHLPVLKYNTHSALSKRWEGVRLDGLNEEDIKEVQKLL
jgi:hypothetical protein